MSGPIIRKYGFANFDKIFGERELKHGVGDEPTSADAPRPVDAGLTPGPVDQQPGKTDSPAKKTADPAN